MKSQRNKEITTATLRLEMPPAPNANAVDTPSYAPGDRSITFKPDNGEPVINTFTVRSAYITAAYKGYGSVTDDDVRASLKPPPWGLLLPPAARSIDLHDFVSLPGDKILSLEGTDGPYGIWDMDAPYSGMWVLFPGESLTNNLPENMVIEFYGGVTPVTATLTYTFRGTGVASNYNYSATLKITSYSIELDIDNQNHWGNDYFMTYYKTPEQRALRDQIGKDKSKILFVNDIDKDGSGTPDYMDGWGCTTTQIPLLEREKTSGSIHRTQNMLGRFVPMNLTLENLPSSFDTSQTLFRFTYPESPPETMQRVALSGSGWDNVGPQGRPPAYKVVSPTGKIRIWKKSGSDARNVATDYIRHNVAIPYSSLIGSDGSARLYLEAINASQNWSDIRIVVSMSVDNGNTWIATRAVRVTSMRCNFTVGVVRQFTRDWVTGERKLFEPDYSSSAKALKKLSDAEIDIQKYYALPLRTPDDWWHDDDALLGHGFVYFQYEGPSLGNTDKLYQKCSVSQYDHKHYWGKTGSSGFTHWDYGVGYENDQKDIAWWDICPYKVEGNFLVLKQTYTLHPERASSLFSTFDDVPNRYANFGLHINQSNKGWGCLSNVGLAMVNNNLDVANIMQCAFSKNVPTPLNKSVWEIILGSEYVTGKTDIERLRFVRRVLAVVIEESENVPWGANVPITQQNGGTLQGKLFNVLNGATIARRNSNTPSGNPPMIDLTITGINQVLLLDHQTEYLHYYDPGLFPGVFGERPKNVFNMDN